jgi:TRAP-type C4-dicarboxylate transport system substrate-binding protein
MKGLHPVVLPLVLLLVTTGSWAADGKVTVKLATLAPDGSVWHKILKEMGNEWRERTEGRVTLRIYAGGVAGDDPDMVRKIRIGQLHAGSLTVAGLGDIDPAFGVFSIPLFFDSEREFSYVLEQLTEELRARLEAKGFVLLHWGHGGWVHLFSKTPVSTVSDLKKVKMFTWAGDDSIFQVWKGAGFHPVALAATDILTGLQTGLIDGLPTTPLAALSMQWFRHTDYMLEPGIAPLLGATVISKKAWSRISGPDRAAVLQASRRVQQRLMVEIPRKDLEAVEEMKRRGLVVVGVESEEHLADWRQTAESLSAEMRGSVVPEAILELALRYRSTFRNDSLSEGSN